MPKGVGTRPHNASSPWLFAFVTIAGVVFLKLAPHIALFTSTPKSDKLARICQMPPAPNNPVPRVVGGAETQSMKPESAATHARVKPREASPALEGAIATKVPLPKKESRSAPKQRSAASSSDAPPLPVRAPKEVRYRFAGRALEQTGRASWYSLDSITASGENMDNAALTAAHNFLPFGTRVRILNIANGRSIVVRINDRGPFIAGRIIDLSKAAAEALDVITAGVADVRLSVIYNTIASASGE